jgi:hypothetical protein
MNDGGGIDFRNALKDPALVSLANWYGARLQRNVTLVYRGKQQFATHRSNLQAAITNPC